MQFLENFFSLLFNLCNKLTDNFWWAIVVFTLFSKIILLPISIMVQKNSIKMVKLYPRMNRIKAKYYGNKDMISEQQYNLYQEEKYHPMLDLIPVIAQLVLLMGVVAAFPPSAEKSPLYMPIGAALSALIMCLAQNKSNVLQSEQSKANKWGTLLFSVALSLYLGLFVSKGVAFYWICSNLMSTLQMYLLNICINPKKSIDYSDLEESRKQLNKVIEQSKATKSKRSKELIAREKKDYKRFTKTPNKQIVFYSEKNGFYKYYKDIIEYILNNTDIIIHYISSDPKDTIFSLESEFFNTYYIDEKLMVTMMSMDADIVVMTTPDLQNYYIKRSLIRNDIEYIFIDHGASSINLTYHKGALDHFDTVFCTNEFVYNEIKAQESTYNLQHKNLIKCGYPLIDNMAFSYSSKEKNKNSTPVILIAPSWQEDNIMDSCIDNILDSILPNNYNVIVRPHPQYVRHYSSKLEALKEKYAKYNNFTLQTDFSSNDTVYDSDILLTDWSGISFEYSFSTLKPCLFINTPIKIMNPDYKDIDIEPYDISIRDKIGISVDLDQLEQLPASINKLLADSSFDTASMQKLRDEYLYNFGTSAKVGAKYIIKSLIEKSRN